MSGPNKEELAKIGDAVLKILTEQEGWAITASVGEVTSLLGDVYRRHGNAIRDTEVLRARCENLIEEQAHHEHTVLSLARLVAALDGAR